VPRIPPSSPPTRAPSPLLPSPPPETLSSSRTSPPARHWAKEEKRKAEVCRPMAEPEPRLHHSSPDVRPCLRHRASVSDARPRVPTASSSLQCSRYTSPKPWPSNLPTPARSLWRTGAATPHFARCGASTRTRSTMLTRSCTGATPALTPAHPLQPKQRPLNPLSPRLFPCRRQSQTAASTRGRSPPLPLFLSLYSDSPLLVCCV
jgi:hypothetical protein